MRRRGRHTVMSPLRRGAPTQGSPHVLVVDSWQAFGGGERYVLRLVDGLRSRGFRFTVAGADPRFLAAAAHAGARIIRMPLVMRQRSTLQILAQVLMWPALLIQYARLVRGAPDISEVHITTLEEQILATALFARLGRRVTWSVHGPIGVRHNPLQRVLYLAAARRVSRIIAVSSGAKATLVDVGIDPQCVEVVLHGVDLPRDPGRPARAKPVVGF